MRLLRSFSAVAALTILAACDLSTGPDIPAPIDPANDTVVRVQRMLYAAEYKRRQAPPGVKITRRSFGRERRYPITNAFREK